MNPRGDAGLRFCASSDNLSPLSYRETNWGDDLMKRWTLFAAVVAALCVGLTAASATSSAGRDPDQLDAYTAVGQAAERMIAEQGVDVSGQRRVANGIELDLVLDQAQADGLRGRGVDLKLTRSRGLTVQEFAAQQAANGFTVWRSYDEPGGIRDQLYAAARKNPQLVKLGSRPHRPGSRESSRSS